MLFGRLRNTFSAGHPFRSSGGDIVPLALIIILGLALRLFSWHQTEIINPDGAVYIHQARAIYYGLWDSVNSCAIRYPTITAFMIAAVYPVLGNWVIAGTFVSLLFGTATLIPLYLLARRFFERDIAALVALVHAVNPMLIDGSVDIIRDSTAWLFAVLGLYFFLNQKKQNSVCLIISSVAFVLATWTRVDFFVLVPISLAYLLWLDAREKPLRKALVFLLPLGMLFLAGIGSMLWVHPNEFNWIRLTEIPWRATAAISQYEQLRLNLAEWINHPPPGIPVEFFHNVKNIVWFIGFGVVFQNAMETFFYPFVLIYLIGLKDIRQRIASDRRVLYFVLITTAFFAVLYCYVFINWEMENRWLALALFSSFPFFGFGLQRLIPLLQSKFNMKRGLALALVGLFIFSFPLLKNTQPRGDDKVVFKTIGEMISSIEGNSQKIKILTTGSSTRWITFYANLHFPGAPCPDEYRDYRQWIKNDYGGFLDTFKAEGMKYLVWEEKNWPKDRFDFPQSPYRRDFVELGTWTHPDTGRISLLKIR
jgi:4-amino-4-deoxy-L-arabinose transferase-like glycosyltransferase